MNNSLAPIYRSQGSTKTVSGSMGLVDVLSGSRARQASVVENFHDSRLTVD